MQNKLSWLLVAPSSTHSESKLGFRVRVSNLDDQSDTLVTYTFGNNFEESSCTNTKAIMK
jgi:hypothetical protein